MDGFLEKANLKIWPSRNFVDFPMKNGDFPYFMEHPLIYFSQMDDDFGEATGSETIPRAPGWTPGSQKNAEGIYCTKLFR